MTTKTVSLSDLDAAQIQALVAQIKAEEAAKVEQAKAERAHAKTLTSEFVTKVVTSVPEQQFTSGARGHSLGGKFEVEGRTFRVSVLIRDEATIPAKES